MNGGIRDKVNRVERTETVSNTRRRLLLGASLLAGSLMGGCGDVNNYYYGMDGGAHSDAKRHDGNLSHDGLKGDSKAVIADKGMPDAKKPSDASCDPKKNNTPLTCQNLTPKSGILNHGESFPIGGSWRLALGDVTYAICPPKALIELQTQCGLETIKYAIPEGSTTTTIQVGATKLLINAKKVAAGYTFGAKWVDLSVKGMCPGDAGVYQPPVLPAPKLWCKSASDQLNQGDSLAVGPIKLQLDDLMVLPCAQKQYALLSVLDSNGNILAKLKIEEGSSEVYALSGIQYKISVPTIGAGGTFAEKWANLDVFVGSSTICK